MTVWDVYQFLRMKECLDLLENAAIFYAADCGGGNWRIEVHIADRKKNTFSSNHRLFELILMPFGLEDTPAAFQRAVEDILSGAKANLGLVYFVDIILY